VEKEIQLAVTKVVMDVGRMKAEGLLTTIHTLTGEAMKDLASRIIMRTENTRD